MKPKFSVVFFSGDTMKFNIHFTTPPHWILACILAVSLALSFTSCSDGSSSSDNDDEQITNPADNSSDSNSSGTGGSGNTSKSSCIIKFDLNGGEGTLPADITAKSGEKITLPAAELTRTGYDFSGWNTSSDGNGSSFAAESSFTVSADITLYAKWNPKKFTVTFDSNNGTGETAAQDFYYKISQRLTENTFSTNGKDFLGWAKTSGGNIAYDDNSEYTIGAADVTLYAVWGKFVTVDNAATVIAELEGGTRTNPNVCTVKIISKEESDKDFLKEIGEKMNSRWNEYVKVNLDLSASGIEEIPENAFKGASLLGITLPNSLESIKTKAFYSTFSLKKIVIPDNVRIIEAEAFYDCCYLTEITLPVSLTNIGKYAFGGCDKIETVNYKGTQAQWEAINISTGNDKLTGANIVYNYTGE